MSGMFLRALIAAVLLSAISPVAVTAVAQGSTQQQTMSLKAGDVIVQQDEDGWATVKIIAVDDWPDGTRVAHCILYKSVPERPELDQTPSLPKAIMHAPMAAGAFATGWQLLGNLPVVKGDQEGFIAYLKFNDFLRYLSVTGQTTEAVVGEANRHYDKANALADAGDNEGAIVEYRKAIDLIPQFYEAIDNMGYSYMDIDRYDVALGVFDDSLAIEPDGVTAFFSRGECLIHLGRLDEAEAVLKQARERYPEERDGLAEFARQLKAARRQ